MPEQSLSQLLQTNATKPIKLASHRDNWRTLQSALARLGLRVRYNLRGRIAEYNLGDTPSGWLPLGNMEDSILQQLLAERFICRDSRNADVKFTMGARFWKQGMHAILSQDQADPFLNWLKDLPPWDGQPRLDTLLHDNFGAEDSHLVRWASRYLCLAAVQRALEPGALIRTVPVLIGDQDIGKTALTSALLPESSVPRWHHSCLTMNTAFEKLIGLMKSCVIVEIGEMSGMKSAPLNSLKAFMSQRHDRVRFPYDRTESDMPRAFVFIGTANGRDVLPQDKTGNTRYVAVPLAHGCNVERLLPPIRKQLWAEALQRHRSGETCALPRALKLQQHEINRKYTTNDDDAMCELLDQHLAWLEREPRSIEAIAQRIGVLTKKRRFVQLSRSLQGCLIRSLRSKGFDSGFRRWKSGQNPSTRWAKAEQHETLKQAKKRVRKDIDNPPPIPIVPPPKDPPPALSAPDNRMDDLARHYLSDDTD